MFLIVLFIMVGILAVVYGIYILRSMYYPKKLLKIKELIRLGKIQASINALKLIIDKDDRNIDARFLIGYCYEANKEKQRAIVEYKYIVKMSRYTKDVTEEKVRTRLAKIYFDLGAKQDAQKEYLILTKINSNNYYNFYMVGLIFQQRSMIDNAINYFRKATSINPKDFDSYFELGHVYFQLNRINDAKAAFIKTIKLKADHFKAHYYSGLILIQLKDYDAAIKEFDIASREPDMRAKALLGKGQSLIEKGDFHNAIAQLERGIKATSSPSDSVTLNLRYFLAASLETIREIPSAITQWEKITEAKKDFRDVNEKLLAYQELRTDDRLKDLMIASNTEYEKQCHQLINSMGFNITKSELLDENSILINASEVAGKWRNTRRSNRLIKIVRTTKPVTEVEVRKLHEEMKRSNSMRAVYITTGTVARSAADYAVTRPIDVIDKTELITLLKKISDAAKTVPTPPTES